jgi:hypothetical protein
VQAKKRKKSRFFHRLPGLDIEQSFSTITHVTLFAVKSHFRSDIIHRIFGGGMGVIHDAMRLHQRAM